jgi:8-oxo-dGTP pyrophosphatase MutT (NUDIX family)
MKTQLRTAGIWIEDSHILLESIEGSGVWGIPGGHLEAEESVEEGCLREFREEMGIDMRIRDLALVNELFYLEDDAVIREYGFYFLVEPAEPRKEPLAPVMNVEKGLRFDWFPLDEIATLTIVPAFMQAVLPGLGTQTLFVSRRETDYPGDNPS